MQWNFEFTGVTLVWMQVQINRSGVYPFDDPGGGETRGAAYRIWEKRSPSLRLFIADLRSCKSETWVYDAIRYVAGHL